MTANLNHTIGKGKEKLESRHPAKKEGGKCGQLRAPETGTDGGEKINSSRGQTRKEGNHYKPSEGEKKKEKAWGWYKVSTREKGVILTGHCLQKRGLEGWEGITPAFVICG